MSATVSDDISPSMFDETMVQNIKGFTGIRSCVDCALKMVLCSDGREVYSLGFSFLSSVNSCFIVENETRLCNKFFL